MDARQKYDSAISAFCKCRLNYAKRLFVEAGAAYNHLYELKKNSEKQVASLCQLNVSVCHYCAGNYQEAATLASKLTTPKVGLEMPYLNVAVELFKDAANRKKKSYWETVDGDYKDMKKRNLHKEIIRLLRDNPYYLGEVNFAEQMRDSCSALGMIEVAASFDRDLTELAREAAIPVFI
jgi:tetratricopeptide (TPR) repeat protein